MYHNSNICELNYKSIQNQNQPNLFTRGKGSRRRLLEDLRDLGFESSSSSSSTVSVSSRKDGGGKGQVDSSKITNHLFHSGSNNNGSLQTCLNELRWEHKQYLFLNLLRKVGHVSAAERLMDMVEKRKINRKSERERNRLIQNLKGDDKRERESNTKKNSSWSLFGVESSTSVSSSPYEPEQEDPDHSLKNTKKNIDIDEKEKERSRINDASPLSIPSSKLTREKLQEVGVSNYSQSTIENYHSNTTYSAVNRHNNQDTFQNEEHNFRNSFMTIVSEALHSLGANKAAYSESSLCTDNRQTLQALEFLVARIKSSNKRKDKENQHQGFQVTRDLSDKKGTSKNTTTTISNRISSSMPYTPSTIEDKRGIMNYYSESREEGEEKQNISTSFSTFGHSPYRSPSRSHPSVYNDISGFTSPDVALPDKDDKRSTQTLSPAPSYTSSQSTRTKVIHSPNMSPSPSCTSSSTRQINYSSFTRSNDENNINKTKIGGNKKKSKAPVALDERPPFVLDLLPPSEEDQSSLDNQRTSNFHTETEKKESLQSNGKKDDFIKESIRNSNHVVGARRSANMLKSKSRTIDLPKGVLKKSSVSKQSNNPFIEDTSIDPAVQASLASFTIDQGNTIRYNDNDLDATDVNIRPPPFFCAKMTMLEDENNNLKEENVQLRAQLQNMQEVLGGSGIYNQSSENSFSSTCQNRKSPTESAFTSSIQSLQLQVVVMKREVEMLQCALDANTEVQDYCIALVTSLHEQACEMASIGHPSTASQRSAVGTMSTRKANISSNERKALAKKTDNQMRDSNNDEHDVETCDEQDGKKSGNSYDNVPHNQTDLMSTKSWIKLKDELRLALERLESLQRLSHQRYLRPFSHSDFIGQVQSGVDKNINGRSANSYSFGGKKETHELGMQCLKSFRKPRDLTGASFKCDKGHMNFSTNRLLYKDKDLVEKKDFKAKPTDESALEIQDCFLLQNGLMQLLSSLEPFSEDLLQLLLLHGKDNPVLQLPHESRNEDASNSGKVSTNHLSQIGQIIDIVRKLILEFSRCSFISNTFRTENMQDGLSPRIVNTTSRSHIKESSVENLIRIISQPGHLNHFKREELKSQIIDLCGKIQVERKLLSSQVRLGVRESETWRMVYLRYMNSLRNLSNGLLKELENLPKYIDALETSVYNIMVAFEEMANSPNGCYKALLKGQAGKDVAHFLTLFESYRDELIDENERIFEEKINQQEKLKMLWEKVVHAEKLCSSHYQSTQHEHQPQNSQKTLRSSHEKNKESKSSNEN